jgi:CRISPR type III-A-associated RAMP protein Csm4
MLYEVVKLRFNSPLFIARGKPGDESSEEIIHSDTLKAAIFSAAVEAGFSVDKEQTENHCPFLDAFDVSSAFPFIGEEYFFPKPQIGLPDIADDTPSFNQHKEKKEIRYIGKSYFEK